ncbi:MAG: glycosyltransferase [Bacilli bacterium]|nr:glycosyltransferase [Bacilli bacterium]
MNVALFTDTYPPEINGVATSTENLRNTLLEHGHQVLVIATNPWSKELLVEDGVIRIPGVEMKGLYGYRLTRVFNDEAMKYLVAFRPDVIHCQTDLSVGIFGLLAARRLGVGSIYTFHTMIEDYAYYVTKGHFDRFARHAVRWFYRQKSNIFDEFIAPSDKIKDYLRSIGVDTTIPVIPTGIDFSRFNPDNVEQAKVDALRKKHGIKKEEKVILSLGRIAKEKSIDLLLRGYAKFLKEGEPEPTRFVITGLGPAEEELKQLCVTLGIQNKVVFTGKCEPTETQYYYGLGDYFASASITETQGLTFMEAMASRLIVLARYDDNLVGTIQDGQTGFFFFDEDGFGTKLREVMAMDAPSRKRVNAAALKAIDVYSMERFYHNIIEVYTRVRTKNW